LRAGSGRKNSTCFGQFLCPLSGVFHCTHSSGICHADTLRAGSGRKNSTCFGQFLCPLSGVFHCTHSSGICHADSLRAGSGRRKLHVSDSSSVNQQGIFTVHTAVVYVMLTACEQDQDGENSTCFGQFLCQSSGVFHSTHSSGICHTGLLTECEQDQDGETSTCFGQFLCPLSGVFHCTHSNVMQIC